MIIGTWPMVVSSHEKPDCALLECSILGVHGLSRRCASHYVGERERETERQLGGARRTFFFFFFFYSPLCNEDSRLIPAARRPVSAFRLLQCALYSPTLKESHALTSSCRLLCAPPPTEERYQDPAEETVSAAISPDDLWARERHRRPPWNLCDRGRVPRGPISRASFARGDGGIPMLRN